MSPGASQGGYCRDPGEDNKGLNGSCVERKKEGKLAEKPSKGRCKRARWREQESRGSLLWAHGA